MRGFFYFCFHDHFGKSGQFQSNPPPEENRYPLHVNIDHRYKCAKTCNCQPQTKVFIDTF